GGWLVLHLCLLASVPATLCAAMPPGTAAATCTCDHGDGQMCPMHHVRTTVKSGSPARSCSCRGTSDPVGALAASLIGPAAVLRASIPLLASPAAADAVPPVSSTQLDQLFVPDAPPPRA